MSEFDDLERRLAARVTAPDPALRGRVLGALEREARGSALVLGLRAAAALVVIGALVGSSARPEGGLSAFRAALEGGVDLRLVEPLAAPMGGGGEAR